MDDQYINGGMEKPLLLVVLAVSAFALNSCNTFIGIGHDIEGLGKGMVNKGNGESRGKSAAPAAQIATPVAPQPTAQ